MEEQISSMKVFKDTENVAIVRKVWAQPQILFHLLITALFKNIMKESDSHERGSLSSWIVWRTFLCSVSLLIWEV